MDSSPRSDDRGHRIPGPSGGSTTTQSSHVIGRRLRWALAAVILAGVGLQTVESQIRGDAAPLGQISFQLARDQPTAAAMVESWSESGLTHLVGFSLGFDYLFLLTYGLGLVIAGRWIRVRARGSRLWTWTGAVVGWTGVTAAALDALENALLLDSLPAGDGPAALVYIIAVTKFALLGVALVLWLLGGVATRNEDRTVEAGHRPDPDSSTVPAGNEGET